MYKKVKLIALLGLAFSTLGVSSIQIAKAEMKFLVDKLTMSISLITI